MVITTIINSANSRKPHHLRSRSRMERTRATYRSQSKKIRTDRLLIDIVIGSLPRGIGSIIGKRLRKKRRRE